MASRRRGSSGNQGSSRYWEIYNQFKAVLLKNLKNLGINDNKLPHSLELVITNLVLHWIGQLGRPRACRRGVEAERELYTLNPVCPACKTPFQPVAGETRPFGDYRCNHCRVYGEVKSGNLKDGFPFTLTNLRLLCVLALIPKLSTFWNCHYLTFYDTDTKKAYTFESSLLINHLRFLFDTDPNMSVQSFLIGNRADMMSTENKTCVRIELTREGNVKSFNVDFKVITSNDSPDSDTMSDGTTDDGDDD